MKELQRKKLLSLKTITKSEEQIMDRNNGLEAKISREETRSKIMIDLGEIPPSLIRVSLQGQILPMRTTVQTTEDHMINAHISNSIEMTEIDLGMELSTTRMGTGETIFLVLHRLKGETIRRIVQTANQEMIGPATLLSADLTIDLRLVLRPTNKNFRKTITRQHLMWFVSPQPTILLMKSQIFAR